MSRRGVLVSLVALGLALAEAGCLATRPYVHKRNDSQTRAEGPAGAAPGTADPALSSQTPTPEARTAEALVVNFGSAEWRLDNAARLTLLEVVRQLRDNPALMVTLEGHTDSVGPPSQNLHLSQRRVDEVRRFLLESGVERNRIAAVAVGEAQPMASNRTTAGRDLNRRVSITLLNSRE